MSDSSVPSIPQSLNPSIPEPRTPNPETRPFIRAGLACVADLSVETRKRIVAARTERSYADFADFLTRVQPAEPEARTLIHAGACDGLAPGPDRTQLLWALAQWRWQAQRAGRGRTGAAPLFDEQPPEAEAIPPPALPPETELERLRAEYRALGFLCACHPMVLFAATTARLRVVKATDLSRFVGRHVRLAGWLITGKLISTRQHEAMQFTTFEDETGLIETVFFPETYARYWHHLTSPGPFLIAGKVEEDFGAVTVTVERLERLAK